MVKNKNFTMVKTLGGSVPGPYERTPMHIVKSFSCWLATPTLNLLFSYYNSTLFVNKLQILCCIVIFLLLSFLRAPCACRSFSTIRASAASSSSVHRHHLFIRATQPSLLITSNPEQHRGSHFFIVNLYIWMQLFVNRSFGLISVFLLNDQKTQSYRF